MRIGSNQIIVRPAMFVLAGSIILGFAGVVMAGIYALGPQQKHGWINSTRWTFAAAKSADASLKMLTPLGESKLLTTREGFSQVNAEEGFEVVVNKAGATPDSVHIRNAINLEREKVHGDLTFSFDGKSAQPFPVTFVIRDSQIKGGGGLLWSKPFTVSGDWNNYSATVPLAAVSKGRVQFMIVTGHLGAQNGTLSLRHIYLR